MNELTMEFNPEHTVTVEIVKQYHAAIEAVQRFHREVVVIPIEELQKPKTIVEIELTTNKYGNSN